MLVIHSLSFLDDGSEVFSSTLDSGRTYALPPGNKATPHVSDNDTQETNHSIRVQKCRKSAEEVPRPHYILGKMYAEVRPVVISAYSKKVTSTTDEIKKSAHRLTDGSPYEHPVARPADNLKHLRKSGDRNPFYSAIH